MKNLYIDFDGVIMNTIDVTYKEIAELNLKKEEEIFEFYRNLDWEELLNNKAIIINDGIECIQKLIDSGLFNISILSHIITIEEAAAKVKFIRKYFKDITFIPAPKVISKTKMVHTKDAILVDDFVGNLSEWEKEGGIGVKFSTKLNGKGFIVIDRLDKLLNLSFDK